MGEIIRENHVCYQLECVECKLRTDKLEWLDKYFYTNDTAYKDTIQYQELTSCSGVYLIIDSYWDDVAERISSREVLYVGSSTNLYQRYKSHPYFRKIERARRTLLSFYFMPCSNYLEYERELIERFRPPFNIQYNEAYTIFKRETNG